MSPNSSLVLSSIAKTTEKMNHLQTVPETLAGVMSAVAGCEDFRAVFFVQVEHLLEVVVSGNDLQPQQWACYKTSAVSAGEEQPRSYTADET